MEDSLEKPLIYLLKKRKRENKRKEKKPRESKAEKIKKHNTDWLKKTLNWEWLVEPGKKTVSNKNSYVTFTHVWRPTPRVVLNSNKNKNKDNWHEVTGATLRSSNNVFKLLPQGPDGLHGPHGSSKSFDITKNKFLIAHPNTGMKKLWLQKNYEWVTSRVKKNDSQEHLYQKLTITKVKPGKMNPEFWKDHKIPHTIGNFNGVDSNHLVVGDVVTLSNNNGLENTNYRNYVYCNDHHKNSSWKTSGERGVRSAYHETELSNGDDWWVVSEILDEEGFNRMKESEK